MTETSPMTDTVNKTDRPGSTIPEDVHARAERLAEALMSGRAKPVLAYRKMTQGDSVE